MLLSGHSGRRSRRTLRPRTFDESRFRFAGRGGSRLGSCRL